MSSIDEESEKELLADDFRITYDPEDGHTVESYAQKLQQGLTSSSNDLKFKKDESAENNADHDPVRTYLEEIGAENRLSSEEKRELAKTISEKKKRLTSLFLQLPFATESYGN